jgi:hypothetical protein
VPLPLALLDDLTTQPAKQAWSSIFAHAWEICSPPLKVGNAANEVTRRDRETAALDLFLAASGWDLWIEYENSVTRTAEELAQWWAAQSGGRAVLILDGLSLREVPWLLQGAAAHGYQVASARVTAAELPAATTPFANALGFGQRSSLENNSAGGAHRLPGARTEAVRIPWADCVKLIGSEPNWVLWHHWPDVCCHEWSEAGQGLAMLTSEAAAQLTSEPFWQLVERLSTGRRLVITSDHGYAASGLFGDTAADDQARYLKELFKSGRNAPATEVESPWVPPVDLAIESRHGRYRYTVGRRKWKSQGGYPTLTHGGLSVLEVASPFVELTR